MTLGELLKYIQGTLSSSTGIFATPQSEEIVCHLTGFTRTQMYVSYNTPLSSEIIVSAKLIVARRLHGEPLPYILRTAFFYDREYIVTPAVLIPRPDTETLIEQILLNEPSTPRRFVDIGTGSGIIISTLTEQRPWNGIGIDISTYALHVAQLNNQSGYSLLCTNKLEAVKQSAQFDFIVSNPPYISETELEQLDPEVRDREPRTALHGGADGLDFYRYFAKNALSFIKSGGNIYCEIGYNQSQKCSELFADHGWCDIKVVNDLGHNPRVIIAHSPERSNA